MDFVVGLLSNLSEKWSNELVEWFDFCWRSGLVLETGLRSMQPGCSPPFLAKLILYQWIGARSITGIPWAESRSWCSAPRSLRCTAPLRAMEEISVLTCSLVVPIFPCCLGLSSSLFLGAYCCYLCRGVISGLASGGFSSWTVRSSLSPPDLQQEEVWWGVPGSVAERQNSAGADLHTDVNDLLDGVTTGVHTCQAAAGFITSL